MDQRAKGGRPSEDTPASARRSRNERSGISPFSSAKPAPRHREQSYNKSLNHNRGGRGTSPRIGRGGGEERGSYSRDRSPPYTYSKGGEKGGRSRSSSPSSYYDDTTDGREALSCSRSRSRSRSNPRRRHARGASENLSYPSVSPPSRQRSRSFSPRRKRNRSSSYSSSSSSGRRHQDLHRKSPHDRPTGRYPSTNWKTRRSTSREKSLSPKQYSSLPSSFPTRRDERERPYRERKVSLSPSRSPPRRSEEREEEEVLCGNDTSRFSRTRSNNTEGVLAHRKNDIALSGDSNHSSAATSFSALLQESLPVVMEGVAEHLTKERTRRQDHQQHGGNNTAAISKLHKTNTFDTNNNNNPHHHASHRGSHRSEKGRPYGAFSSNKEEADGDGSLLLDRALMADYVLVPPPELAEAGVASSNKNDAVQPVEGLLLEEGDMRFKSGFNRPRSPPPVYCPPHPQAESAIKISRDTKGGGEEKGGISFPPYTSDEQHEQATYKYIQQTQSNEIILTNVWSFMEEESIIRAIKRAVAIHEGTHDRRYDVHKMWMPRRTVVAPQKKETEEGKPTVKFEAKSSAEKPKQPAVVEVKAMAEPGKCGNVANRDATADGNDDDDLLGDIDDLLKDLEDEDDDDDDNITNETTSKPEEKSGVVKQMPLPSSTFNFEKETTTVSTSATPPNSKAGEGGQVSSSNLPQARSPAAAAPSATTHSLPNLNPKGQEKKPLALSRFPAPFNEKRRGPRSWNAKPLPLFEDEEFDDVVINTCRNPLYQPGGPLDVNVLYQKAKKRAIAAVSEKPSSSRGGGLNTGEGSSHPPINVNYSSICENTFDYYNVRGELRVTGMCPLFRSSCHRGIIPSQSNLLRQVQRSTSNGGPVAFIPPNYPPSSTTGLVWYSNPDGPVDELTTPFAVIVQFATVLDCERVLRALRSPYRKHNRCRDVLFVPHRAYHPLPFETRRSPHFTSPFVSAVTVYPYPDPSDCMLPRTPTQDELFAMCYHRDAIARSSGALASNRGVGWRIDAVARGEIDDDNDTEEEPHKIGGGDNNNMDSSGRRTGGGGPGARTGEELLNFRKGSSRKEGAATKAAEPSHDPARVTALHRFMAEDPARVRELKEFLTTLFDNFDRLHPADKEFYNANMKVFMATASNTPATSFSAVGSEVDSTTTTTTTTNSLAAQSLSVKERLALKRAALEAAKNQNSNDNNINNGEALSEAHQQTATQEKQHMQASAAPPVPTARELLMQKLAAKRAELGLATSNSSTSSSSTPTVVAENPAAAVIAATDDATPPSSVPHLPSGVLGHSTSSAILATSADATFSNQKKTVPLTAGTTGRGGMLGVAPATASPAVHVHQLPPLSSLPTDEAEDAALERFFASEHRSRNVLLILAEHTRTHSSSNNRRSSGRGKRGRDDDEKGQEYHNEDQQRVAVAQLMEALKNHSSDGGAGGVTDGHTQQLSIAAEPDWYFRSSDARTHPKNENGNYHLVTANSIGNGTAAHGNKPSSIPIASAAPPAIQQQQQQPSTAFLYGGPVPALFSFGFPLPPSTQLAIANSATQQQSALADSQNSTAVDSAAFLALSKAAWAAKSFAPHLCRHNVISRYAFELGGTTAGTNSAGEGAENENTTENDNFGPKDGNVVEAPFCPLLSLAYDIQMKGVSAEAIRNAQQWLR